MFHVVLTVMREKFPALSEMIWDIVSQQELHSCGTSSVTEEDLFWNSTDSDAG
jgi:hypothetical protein